MHDTTDSPASFSPSPDDELRQLLQHLVSAGRLLEPDPEPHNHAGVRASTSEFFALGELVQAQALSQHELGVRLGLEKSTVSRLAASLEQRGWLERVRDPDDRRVYRLTLTDAGRKVATQVGDELRRHHAALLSRLSPEEHHGLFLGLRGLIRELHTRHRHSS